MAPKVFEDVIGFSEVDEQATKSVANENVAASIIDSANASSAIPIPPISNSSKATNKAMRERAVPATQAGRLFGFGSLAVRMAMGVAVERASNSFFGGPQQTTISDDNAERLAEAL